MKGGKRIGAGRPKSAAPYRYVTVRINPDLYDEFKLMAERFKSKINGKN